MIATCTNCQARYQLENEKIPARMIQVRCPGCQSVFSLDGSLAQVEEAAPLVTNDFEPPVAVETPPAPEPAAPEPVAPAPPTPVVAAEPPSPYEQPAAVVEPAVATSFPGESTPVVETAPAPVTAAAGVATLDEPAPATGSKRRRRCKEEMMARALVSDILVYNRETRDTALAEGNLLEALGGEIKKSWELYKEKVTPEVANSSTYFREALNEILADGDQLF